MYYPPFIVSLNRLYLQHWPGFGATPPPPTPRRTACWVKWGAGTGGSVEGCPCCRDEDVWSGPGWTAEWSCFFWRKPAAQHQSGLYSARWGTHRRGGRINTRLFMWDWLNLSSVWNVLCNWLWEGKETNSTKYRSHCNAQSLPFNKGGFLSKSFYVLTPTLSETLATNQHKQHNQGMDTLYYAAGFVVIRVTSGLIQSFQSYEAHSLCFGGKSPW